MDWLDVVVVAMGLAICVAAWIALIMAELGLFLGAPAAAMALALALFIAFWTAWSLARRMHIARTALPIVVVSALTLLLAIASLSRPHEYILGGLDSGVYVNTSIQIAQSGGIIWYDRDLAFLPISIRQMLFANPDQISPTNARSLQVGLYLTDLNWVRVIPHGLHLLPSAMAIGFALAGVAGSLATVPIFSIVAIGAAALLARRMAGPIVGLSVALLLIVNPAENWFGRYPAAEMIVQSCLFLGLFVLSIALAHRQMWLAGLAGFMVGLVHLAKIETLSVPVAIVVVFAGTWLLGRVTRVHCAFLAGYLLMGIHAAVHAGLIAMPYVYGVVSRSIPSVNALLYISVVGFGCVTVVLVLASRGLMPRKLPPSRRRKIAQLATSGRVLVTVAVLFVAGFAWYVRPLDLWGEIAATAEPLQFVVRNRLHSFPRLGWYLPPLAILFAVVGFLAALRRTRDPAVGLLLVAIAIEALIVLGDPRITPEYPWAARRWIGILIPGAIILAACQLRWLVPGSPPVAINPSGLPDTPRWEPGIGVIALPRLSERSRIAYIRVMNHVEAAVTRGIVPTVLLIAMIAPSISATRIFFNHREYAGSADLIRRITTDIPSNAIVLFDDDLVGWRLSTPVRFLTNRGTLVLFDKEKTSSGYRAALDAWSADGRPLYWIRIDEPKPFEAFGRQWQSVGRWNTELREAVPTTEMPPSQIRAFDVPIALYRAQ